MDVVRTRYVSQDGSLLRRHNGHVYSSVIRALRAIIAQEGMHTLFRGSLVAVVGSTTAWGLYMFIYRTLCNIHELTSYTGRSVVSIFSSCIVTCITSPIFMLKSRMQLEELSISTQYRSFLSGLKHAIRTEGVLSL
uniref:Mitochondrial substrate carrier family protein M n=1 Tax=Lygus hesperus TaxID=30085 RepID=A0A0A9YTJ5_LYGHE